MGDLSDYLTEVFAYPMEVVKRSRNNCQKTALFWQLVFSTRES